MLVTLAFPFNQGLIVSELKTKHKLPKQTAMQLLIYKEITQPVTLIFYIYLLENQDIMN